MSNNKELGPSAPEVTVNPTRTKEQMDQESLDLAQVRHPLIASRRPVGAHPNLG